VESPINRLISMLSWFRAAAAGCRGDAIIESRYSIDLISGYIYAITKVGNDLLTNPRFCLRLSYLPFEINFNATPPHQGGAKPRRLRRHMTSERPSSDRHHGFQEHHDEQLH
jgi:hypothetical protein